VCFPEASRTLGGGYRAIRSEDFDRRMRAVLGNRVRLGARVEGLTADQVTLPGGEVLRAGCVVDARGWAGPPGYPCGFQKFLGLDVTLEQPHGLAHPVLMDARVEQTDGFRFVYLLPWDERSLLIEDTYYSDTPGFDRARLRDRIGTYLDARGWRVAQVHREESAALPIPLDGPAPSPALATLGVGAGLFHATTGYSLPFALRAADVVSALPALGARAVFEALTGVAARHWKQQGFFRLLNRMLFRGATPEQRRFVFESFYRHPEMLIAHFYSGRLSPGEVLRVLARGSKTVPGRAALKAALG